MEKLDAGNSFPNLEVPTVAGNPLAIPQDFRGRYAVLLFYRGGW